MINEGRLRNGIGTLLVILRLAGRNNAVRFGRGNGYPTFLLYRSLPLFSSTYKYYYGGSMNLG
jgi:hypothetical protein